MYDGGINNKYKYMTKNAVGWFEIYVDDMDRATKFYEAVFGGELEKMKMPDDFTGMEMRSFGSNYEVYGAAGALVKMDGVKPGVGGTLVYFSCDDCATEAARVSDAGGTVQQKKMSIGEYGFISMIEDTEGNTIGLHSQK